MFECPRCRRFVTGLACACLLVFAGADPHTHNEGDTTHVASPNIVGVSSTATAPAGKVAVQWWFAGGWKPGDG
jgi:hypothetical protein